MARFGAQNHVTGLRTFLSITQFRSPQGCYMVILAVLDSHHSFGGKWRLSLTGPNLPVLSHLLTPEPTSFSRGMWYCIDCAKDTDVPVWGTAVDFYFLLCTFPIYPEFSTITMWYLYNHKNVDVIHKKRTNKKKKFWRVLLLGNILHYHLWICLLHSGLAKWHLRSTSVFPALCYKLRFHLT